MTGERVLVDAGATSDSKSAVRSAFDTDGRNITPAIS
jgi:hypothetical protein